MSTRKKRTVELPDFDTLWKIGAVVGAMIFGYIEFTKELDLLRMEMDGANRKIEELIAKHIAEEEERFEEMQEQVKWYQRKKKK
jgi:hypothetical protein